MNSLGFLFGPLLLFVSAEDAYHKLAKVEHEHLEDDSLIDHDEDYVLRNNCKYLSFINIEKKAYKICLSEIYEQVVSDLRQTILVLETAAQQQQMQQEAAEAAGTSAAAPATQYDETRFISRFCRQILEIIKIRLQLIEVYIALRKATTVLCHYGQLCQNVISAKKRLEAELKASYLSQIRENIIAECCSLTHSLMAIHFASEGATKKALTEVYSAKIEVDTWKHKIPELDTSQTVISNAPEVFRFLGRLVAATSAKVGFFAASVLCADLFAKAPLTLSSIATYQNHYLDRVKVLMADHSSISRVLVVHCPPPSDGSDNTNSVDAMNKSFSSASLATAVTQFNNEREIEFLRLSQFLRANLAKIHNYRDAPLLLQDKIESETVTIAKLEWNALCVIASATPEADKAAAAFAEKIASDFSAFPFSPS